MSLTLFQVVYSALRFYFSIPQHSYLWLYSQTFLSCPCCLLAEVLWLGRGPVFTSTHWTSCLFPGDLPAAAEISWAKEKPVKINKHSCLSLSPDSPAHTALQQNFLLKQRFSLPVFPSCSGPVLSSGHQPRPSWARSLCPAQPAHTCGTAAAQRFQLLL